MPLQALLTLSGNVGCAVAAWRIAAEGERMLIGDGDGDGEGDAVGAQGTGTGTVAVAAAPSWAPAPDMSFPLKLAGWSVFGSVLVKYGELSTGDFFFTPTYPKALAIIAIPTLVGSPIHPAS